MARRYSTYLSGAAAGLANGLFGGGGGMVVIPILNRYSALTPQQLYATCVGLIFPVCAISAAVYLFNGGISLSEAFPYLAGGTLGGWIGGKLYGRISPQFLKWLFAGFLFYAGVKYLL